jgi:hypothetical protein
MYNISILFVQYHIDQRGNLWFRWHTNGEKTHSFLDLAKRLGSWGRFMFDSKSLKIDLNRVRERSGARFSHRQFIITTSTKSQHWTEYNWNAISNRKFEAKHEGRVVLFFSRMQRARSTRHNTNQCIPESLRKIYPKKLLNRVIMLLFR